MQYVCFSFFPGSIFFFPLCSFIPLHFLLMYTHISHIGAWISLGQGFSALALWKLGPDNSLFWMANNVSLFTKYFIHGHCPVRWRMFCSISGLYPLEASTTHPITVSPGRGCGGGGKICLYWEPEWEPDWGHSMKWYMKRWSKNMSQNWHLSWSCQFCIKKLRIHLLKQVCYRVAFTTTTTFQNKRSRAAGDNPGCKHQQIRRTKLSGWIFLSFADVWLWQKVL